MAMKNLRPKRHYVNNKDLFEALKDYKIKLIEKPEAKIPDYIGICIQKICTRLATKSNFIGYSFKDEMISDGIENCIYAVPLFDPNKTDNPFAYFTQISYNAFLRRIAKEKKQSYIKGKLIQDMPFEAFEVQEGDEDREFHNAYLEFMQNNHTFDDSFIERKKEKKKKKQANLDNFIGEENVSSSEGDEISP